MDWKFALLGESARLSVAGEKHVTTALCECKRESVWQGEFRTSGSHCLCKNDFICRKLLDPQPEL